MAQHSTHLQNLTHQDIIRIGTQFESELRAELKSAAEAETEQKLAEQAANHRAECERLEAEKNELKAEHEKEEIEKKNSQNAIKLNQLENAVAAKGNLKYWYLISLNLFVYLREGAY